MKKYLCLLLFCSIPFKAFCTNDARAIEQVLSTFGEYKNVTITENESGYTLKFPQTNTIKQTLDDHGKLVTVSGTVPAYEATAVKNGRFDGQNIYKISTNSPNALLSYIYQKYKTADIDVSEFSAAFNLVPSLNLIKSVDMNIQDLVIKSAADQELGKIKQAILKSNINIEGDKLIFNAISNIKDAYINVLIFSVSVPEYIIKGTATYDNTSNIDYSQIPNDISSLQHSKSVIEIKNGEFTILGIPLSASVGTSNKIDISDDGNTMQLTGKFVAKNIKLGNSSADIPQELLLQYNLSDIDRHKAIEFQNQRNKLRDFKFDDQKSDKEKLEEFNKLDKSCDAIADDIMKDIKLNLKGNVKYEKASIDVEGNFYKSGDYLAGKGNVVINNLDILYPDLTAKCEQDKKEMQQKQQNIADNQNIENTIDSCIKNKTNMELRKYIDFQKRTTDTDGQTVDKVELIADETGIYANGQKVKDAMSLKFDKKKAPIDPSVYTPTDKNQ
ncbi:MAG: hypothetical protein J6T72_03110 [Alphaproteobacteria bacterium]|nr:hypothetical protein [Alphaproteobacteria bacterium]